MLTLPPNIRSSTVLVGWSQSIGWSPSNTINLNSAYTNSSMVRGVDRGQQCKLIQDVRVNIPPPPLTQYATKASEPRSGILQAEHFGPKSCLDKTRTQY